MILKVSAMKKAQWRRCVRCLDQKYFCDQYLVRKVLIYYSFYIFEYDAEYGVECSAESGAE